MSAILKHSIAGAVVGLLASLIFPIGGFVIGGAAAAFLHDKWVGPDRQLDNKTTAKVGLVTGAILVIPAVAVLFLGFGILGSIFSSLGLHGIGAGLGIVTFLLAMILVLAVLTLTYIGSFFGLALSKYI